MKSIAVLYHNRCHDGFGGAWAAWKKLGSKADYIPVNHQEPYPKGLKGKRVYLIDFCYPRNIIKNLAVIAEHLVVIDHHISAKAVTETVPDHLYSDKHSGAVLAWKYFHPQKPIPKLLLYIEDNDLWNFKLAFSQEIQAALDNYDYKFNLWDKLARELESSSSRKKYIQEGETIVKYQKHLIEEIAKCAEEVKFCGYRTLAVNSSIRDLRSEIAHHLYIKMPPLAIVWHHNGKRIDVSLRSNGKVDVSKLAVRFGGGGHRAAAGFAWPLNKPLPWKKIKQ